FARIDSSTNTVQGAKVTPTVDTITVLMSDDTGAATIISYQVLRAAAYLVMRKTTLWYLIVISLCGCSLSGPRLHTEILSDGCIKPLAAYHYKTCTKINFKVNHSKFEVPANFETDLASIPRVFWPIVAPAHSSLI